LAKSTITTLGSTAYPVNASTWKFPLANALQNGAVGANNALLSSRPAGTYSNLRGKCSANSTSAATTLRFTDGAANSACVVSITAGSTGAFEDTINTESVTDGSTCTFTYAVTSGTGTSTLTIAQIDFEPTDTTKTVSVFGTGGSPSATTASATYYHGISGSCHNGNTTTEADTQFQFKKSCTLKNWRVRVLTDGRTGSTTYRLRKNGANAAQSISTSATGLFEDTTNTDSIVADDKVNVQVVLPSGTQAVSWTATAVNVETTDNISFFGTLGGTTANANATTYLNYGYTLSTNTLANTQIKLYRDAIVGNLSLYINANSVNGSTTIRLNDDGTNINPQVSVSAAATGLFADTSNTATVAANSLLSPVIIAGGSSGTIGIAALLHEVRPNLTQVSTTKTHKYNIIGKITATKTHKYNIIGKITRTKTHKYNIVTKVTKSAVHVYNIIGKITRTRTHKYNIIAKITATKTHKYNIIGKITQTKTHKYNIVTKVTQTRTHKYNIIGKVTQTKTHKYHVEGKVTSSKTHKYNIIARVSTTKTHKYNILNKVTTTKTHKYNIIGKITTTKTHRFNIIQQITRTHTHKYDIIGKIVATKTHKFNILQKITIAKTHVYNIIAGITRSATHKYDILQQITQTKTHKYNIMSPFIQVTTTKTHKYNVLSGIIHVDTTKTHLFSILQKITTTKTHRFDSIALVQRSRTHKYNIIQQIIRSKIHKFNIIGKITVTKQHRFAILNKVTRTKTHKYNIITKVTRTRTHKYNIIGKVTVNKTHRYQMGGKVSTTKTHRYNITGKLIDISDVGGYHLSVLKFPERIRIVDIISDLNNRAIANIEISPEQNLATATVMISEYSQLLTASTDHHHKHRIQLVSGLILPEIIDTIQNKTHCLIGIESFEPQEKSLHHIEGSLLLKTPKNLPIYASSQTQLTQDKDTIIRVASNTEVVAAEGSNKAQSFIVIPYNINRHKAQSRGEMVEPEKVQRIKTLIKLLKSNDLFG